MTHPCCDAAGVFDPGLCDTSVFGTEVTQFVMVPAGRYAAIPLQKFFRDVKYTLKPRDVQWSPISSLTSEGSSPEAG